MSKIAIISIEGVPNPNAMKFVLENGLLVDRPYEFLSYQEAAQAPLARKILMLRYVDRVVLNRNYITVLKNLHQSPPWDQILPELKSLIQQHLDANEPIIYVGNEAMKHDQDSSPLQPLIVQMLDQHIRPAAQADGGDILFESYENGVLNLSMHGSCHGCPYAKTTIKEGVEKLFSNLMPEVKQVIAKENQVL